MGVGRVDDGPGATAIDIGFIAHEVRAVVELYRGRRVGSKLIGALKLARLVNQCVVTERYLDLEGFRHLHRRSGIIRCSNGHLGRCRFGGFGRWCRLLQLSHFLRLGGVDFGAGFFQRTGTFEDEQVEHYVDTAEHRAKHTGLAFLGGFAVDRLIDVQPHVGDAGADHRQCDRPADDRHRTEHFHAGAEVTDPQFFAQIAIGGQ
ncbi:hypothetical protein D3C87_1335110 [compost metagenome]